MSRSWSRPTAPASWRPSCRPACGRVSTEISPETGAGGFILPNDRVDVILTKREKNPDRKGGDVVQSEIILSNIRVLAIDQAPKEKEGINSLVGRTATLELKPEQAETLARARQTGTLSLALRSITDGNDGRRPVRGSGSKAKRERQRGSLRGRQSNDGTEVTERTPEMKFGENQSAMRTVAARALLLSAVAALTLAPLLPVVGSRVRQGSGDDFRDRRPVKMRFLSLGIGKSVVVDLPRDVKDVLVADPEDRQRRRSLLATRLYHRRRGRPDQRGVFRRRWPASRFLRHRGQARPQRRARRAEGRRCRASRSRASATA